jgi:hypothetical protein
MEDAMVTFEQYKAAADRIRTGRERAGDSAVCDAWDKQPVPKQDTTRGARGWWDRPVARACWEGDAKDTAR